MGGVGRRAAFLDRDGTLNVRPARHEYVRCAHDFVWLDGAAEGIAALVAAGYRVFVVSNQRGVARGLVTTATLREIERHIQQTLAPLGASVEEFYYCVHDLEAACSCRKPRPGMLTAAAARHGLDLASSWMIGDTPEDVEAGRRAACATAIIGTSPVEATVSGRSLAEVAERIARYARCGDASRPCASAGGGTPQRQS